MLIDVSYFVGEINIPNCSIDDITNGVENPTNDNLMRFIRKYEIEILRSALGMDLYRNFMNALGQKSDGTGYDNVTNGRANNSVDQKWKDLLNGAEYYGLDSRLHKWQGFIALQDDTSSPKSLIANYVYYKYLKNAASLTTGIGEVISNADNSTNTSIMNKSVNAWNEMVEWLHDLIWFMDTKISYDYNYYPGWILQNRYLLLSHFQTINSFNI